MDVGIIGLPFVGKTTVFNALTRENARIGTFSSGQEANQSVVKVPDRRLDRLAEIFQPKRTVSATMHYIDIAGISKGTMKQGSMDAQLLADLRQVDALAHVVRVFEDDNVPHIDEDLDPIRDIENMNLELSFADLQIIETRLDRLAIELRTHKNPQQQAERDLLVRCQESLEAETPLRELDFTPDETKILRGYRFLTQKPLLLVLNIGESQLGQQTQIVHDFAQAAGISDRMIPLCALLEMEIAQLDEADAGVFLEDMGLEEPALIRFIQISYELLGLQTFFTGGDKEVHAWTVPHGTTALEAAGKIHTDMARGFIRAETISFDELDRCGSIARAREAGALRLEGKEYIIQDGDVILIRFNV